MERVRHENELLRMQLSGQPFPPCLSIADVPGAGIGVFANQDIKEGQILVEEAACQGWAAPFLWAENVARFYCSYCFSPLPLEVKDRSGDDRPPATASEKPVELELTAIDASEGALVFSSSSSSGAVNDGECAPCVELELTVLFVSCLRASEGCSERYCHEDCRAAADAEFHSRLCRATDCGAQYAGLALSSDNEYYLLAAKMFAQYAVGINGGETFPWAPLRSQPWWRTMQRPTYSSSSSSSDSDDSSDRGQAEGRDEPSLIDEAGRAELDAFYRNAVKDQTRTAAHRLQQMLPEIADVLTVEALAECIGAIRVNALSFTVRHHAVTVDVESGRAWADQEHDTTSLQVQDHFAESLKVHVRVPSSPSDAPSTARCSFQLPALSGFAIFPFQSCFNHKCPDATAQPSAPNCYCVEPSIAVTSARGETAGGPRMAIRCCVVAARDVAKGEELSIDYLVGKESGTAAAAVERRGILLGQYGICCRCSLCFHPSESSSRS